MKRLRKSWREHTLKELSVQSVSEYMRAHPTRRTHAFPLPRPSAASPARRVWHDTPAVPGVQASRVPPRGSPCLPLPRGSGSL